MAIGALSRLGVANCTVPNASSFAQVVLLLPSNAPVYQQQIVHSTEWLHGPGQAASEWCSPPDAESMLPNVVLRELSTHHTQFARRNLTNTPRFAYVWYRSNTTNQIFYINNEAELGCSIATQAMCSDPDCWDPPNRQIDDYFNSAALVGVCWPNPQTQFWQSAIAFIHRCGAGDSLRIRPEALAYVFLTLKRNAEGQGRGHIVLPPASSDARLGSSNTYYQTFFDKIHKSPSGVGVPGSAPIQAQISVSELRALHIHQYAPIPTGGMTPLDSVASSATAMRKGADWYRNNYNSGSDIPVDIMLSEMGPDWRLEGNIKWAGGWANFRTGLSWWNSWLRWLTLSASSDCRLQGWQSFTRFVYGCIHEASVPPHATYEAPAPSGRNQWYVDCDAWNTYVHYDVPHVGTGLPADGRYQGTFSAWDSVQWGRPPSSSADALWRRTPFAACYAT